MDARVYCNVGGIASLFDKAPPLAEVVLEVIGEDEVIYAESFKTGAKWWDSYGSKNRTGIRHVSDYACLATRAIRPGMRGKAQVLQAEWEYARYADRTKEEPMIQTTRPCMSCGEAVADGAVHQCSHRWVGTGTKLNETLSPCPDCGMMGAYFCTKAGINKAHINFTPKINIDTTVTDELPVPATAKKPPQGQFTSIFDPKREQFWISMNTKGRMKLCMALMKRLAGKCVDVCLDPSIGFLRIGEAPHGRPLSTRGFINSRWLTDQVDFGDQTLVTIALDDYSDGWLYGVVPLKDTDGSTMEG